uniref:Uncharacterized protein n=1 Tax=Arundo donax TaxID=35708 RepID=A0A0A9CHG7_ARUDO
MLLTLQLEKTAPAIHIIQHYPKIRITKYLVLNKKVNGQSNK